MVANSAIPYMHKMIQYEVMMNTPINKLVLYKTVLYVFGRNPFLRRQSHIVMCYTIVYLILSRIVQDYMMRILKRS